VSHLFIVLGLVKFILLHELIDFLLFLVQNLVLLLLITRLTSFVVEVIVNLLDTSVVLVDRLSHFGDPLVLLLDLSVLLLDSIHETLSSFREWKVGFVGLELKVLLLLLEDGLFLTEMLGSLFQGVLL